MRQQLRTLVQRLEGGDQSFHRERHDDYHQEARQVAPHPRRRAHLRGADHLLLHDGLRDLQRHDRDGQQADGLDDGLGGGLDIGADGRPAGFHGDQHQHQRDGDEQRGDHRVDRGEETHY